MNWFEKKYDAIATLLKAGCKGRSFRSGGGLRVLRIEDDKGALKAYGEHFAYHTAMEHLEEDAVAGHRLYETVYNNEVYTHYLTGTTDTDSNIDRWTLGGHKLLFSFEDGQFVVEAKGTKDDKTPQEMWDRARPGRKITWKRSGVTYQTEWDSTKIIDSPSGHSWFIQWSHTFKGDTFASALQLCEEMLFVLYEKTNDYEVLEDVPATPLQKEMW